MCTYALTVHVHPVPSVRMSGGVHPLLQMPGGVHKDSFNFAFAFAFTLAGEVPYGLSGWPRKLFVESTNSLIAAFRIATLDTTHFAVLGPAGTALAQEWASLGERHQLLHGDRKELLTRTHMMSVLMHTRKLYTWICMMFVLVWTSFGSPSRVLKWHDCRIVSDYFWANCLQLLKYSELNILCFEPVCFVHSVVRCVQATDV
jgi:hypothetical protein